MGQLWLMSGLLAWQRSCTVLPEETSSEGLTVGDLDDPGSDQESTSFCQRLIGLLKNLDLVGLVFFFQAKPKEELKSTYLHDHCPCLSEMLLKSSLSFDVFFPQPHWLQHDRQE